MPRCPPAVLTPVITSIRNLAESSRRSYTAFRPYFPSERVNQARASVYCRTTRYYRADVLFEWRVDCGIDRLLVY